jgi:Protein of unknown function (DUF1552)
MSNILSQRWIISRRHFLRGLGVTVALPLLDAMRPLRAVAAAAADKPRRSVFAYIPNGVNGLAWQVAKAGRDYEFSESLKPLAKHRKNLTIFSGLHHPNGIGSQHVCADLFLTGAKLDTNQRSVRNTVSCDQLMAEVTSLHTRFSSLELSVAAGVGQPNNSTTLAFSRDGAPLPAEENARAVFNRLFVEDAGGVKAEGEKLKTHHSVLDAVLDDAKSLRRALGQDDRTKLDEYLHSVRDVETRTERLESWLDVPKPKLDKEEIAHFQRNVTKAQAGEYYRTMYDLIVLALRTDMTRVVTYMSGSEGNGIAIPEIGVTQMRHSLSHHNGDPVILDRLARSDAFIMQQFAYFLDRLQTVQDGDEPLLDRTMVLVGSGMSFGHGHHNANLPVLFAGGRGLGFKHGQHIDYNLPKIGAYKLDYDEWRAITSRPQDDKARLSNLMLTMLQKMDVHTEQFVDSLAPVSEIIA